MGVPAFAALAYIGSKLPYDWSLEVVQSSIVLISIVVTSLGYIGLARLLLAPCFATGGTAGRIGVTPDASNRAG